MFEGLLPIGSVVLLKDSSKRVMIVGVLQKQIKEGDEVVWDYSACLYPEGYMGPDKTFLFDHEQIEKVYAIGYQDEEQFTFKQNIDVIRNELRAGTITLEELANAGEQNSNADAFQK